MPRKSTFSASTGDAKIPMPSKLDDTAGPTVEGDASILSVVPEASGATKTKPNGKAAKDEQDSLGVDDLLLPRTLTSRLARGVLPANTSIQKDALLALTKAATVFISYLAHNANELTQKKTVGPQDVLKAIHEIEMDGVMGLGQTGPDGKVGGRLERELEVFESVVKGKRKGYREKVKARESGASNLGSANGSGNGDDGGEREAKRARFENGDNEDPGSGQRSAASSPMPSSTRKPQSKVQHGHEASPANGPPSTSRSRKSISQLPQGDTTSDNNLEDEKDSNAEEQEGEERQSENDEDDQDTDDNEEEEEEEVEEDEEEEEEQQPGEEDLDGYGPDDQLRHDMNGADEDEDSLAEDSD